MIAVLGDILVDVLAKTDRPLAVASDTPASISMSPGGSAAGTAAWLAHDGEAVCLLGAVGEDAMADLALSSLIDVDLRLHRIAGLPTGCCVVIVGADGERTMLPDAGANIGWFWRPSDLEGVSHLHVSAYPAYRDETHATLMDAMASARSQGITVSLDLASSEPIRGQRARAIAALSLADLAFANLDELHALLGDGDAHQLLAVLLSHVDTAVIKRGPLGCIAGTGDQTITAPALPALVVDSTGAGDAFSAGFLPTWLARGSLADCVADGQRSAVRTLGRVGAGPIVGEQPQ